MAGAACLFVLLLSFGLWFAVPFGANTPMSNGVGMFEYFLTQMDAHSHTVTYKAFVGGERES